MWWEILPTSCLPWLIQRFFSSCGSNLAFFELSKTFILKYLPLTQTSLIYFYIWVSLSNQCVPLISVVRTHDLRVFTSEHAKEGPWKLDWRPCTLMHLLPVLPISHFWPSDVLCTCFPCIYRIVYNKFWRDAFRWGNWKIKISQYTLSNCVGYSRGTNRWGN